MIVENDAAPAQALEHFDTEYRRARPACDALVDVLLKNRRRVPARDFSRQRQRVQICYETRARRATLIIL